MSIGIVTDTGSDLPPDVEKEMQVITVPLLFRFGMEEFPDKTIPMQSFLERVKKTWPTTSAPSPGVYIEAFKQSLEANDQVLCITITGKHSASYSSAVIASQEFPPGQVTVFDSASLSIGQGFLTMSAYRAAKEGANLQEIITLLETLQRRSHIYIALDTVENLVKGGRASQMSGFLAEILKIRPILTLVDGQLTMCERARGRESSKQKLIKLAAKHYPIKFVCMGHVGCEEEAAEIASVIAKQSGIPKEEIAIIETGMAIAVHSGPNTLGLLVVSRQ